MATQTMPQSETGHSPFRGQTSLLKHQKFVLVVAGLGNMLETWDSYVIGYIMASLIRPWGLTYGVMGAVLLASGIGSIFGGAFWGGIADRYGRKTVLVTANAMVALACVAMAFTPDRNWGYLVVFRVLVGIATASYFPLLGMCHEFVPPARRGTAAGFVASVSGCGMLLGALSGAYLIPNIGWRGTFALGASPMIIAVIAYFFVPESPRWLAMHGREADARKSIAWALGSAVYEGPIEMPATDKTRSWTELFTLPRACITTMLINLGLITAYAGIVMWAPMMISQVQSISLATAGKIMIGISVLGVPLRLVAAMLTDKIGRKATGATYTICSAVFVMLAGLVGHGSLLTPSLFWLPLLVGFACADGAVAVCSIYSTELWPSSLRGVGSGWASLCGAFGKIVGPMGLALIVGSKDLIMPAATKAAIVPAYGFLAFFLLVCGLTFLFSGVENKGRSIESIDNKFETDRKH